MPFLRQGISAGQKCVYITDTRSPAALEAEAESLTLAGDVWLTPQLFGIIPVTEIPTCDADGMLEGVLQYLESVVRQALADGAPAVRITIEMTCLLPELQDVTRLLAFERRINALVNDLPALALCQYDRLHFTPGSLIEVLRTHPYVLIGAELFENFYHIADMSLPDEAPEALALRQWLDNLVARRHAEVEMHQRNTQLEALVWATGMLTSTLELDPLLANILQAAMRVIPAAQKGSVLLLDAATGNLCIRATKGYQDQRLRGLCFARGEGYSSRTLCEGAVLITDAQSAAVYYDSAFQEVQTIQSAVAAPLYYRGKSIGAISLENFDRKAAFAKTDLELLATFADYAAVAVGNAYLYEEERRRRQEADTLQAAALACTAAIEPRIVFDRILEELQKVVPYDSASIQVLAENALELVGGRGFPNLPALLGVKFPIGAHNPNHEVIHRRAAFIVADVVQEYENFRVEPHAPASIRSWLGVPMLIGERLIGMLALDKREPGFYTSAHAQLVNAFAAQAATALENSRLFEAERRQRELAQALAKTAAAVSSTLDLNEVFDRIMEQVALVVPGDAFNIMLIEKGAVRVARFSGYASLGAAAQIAAFAQPLEEYPLLEQMRLTGEPVLVTDTQADPAWVPRLGMEWLRAYVAVPIWIENQIVGFLNVDGVRAQQFTAHDAWRLAAFASHAATAIQNARLYQSLQAHAEQLETRVQERTAALQAQYARLEAILRSVSDGIIVTDAAGKILQVNPVAASWLQQVLSPEDAGSVRQAIKRLALRATERPEQMLELKGLDIQLRVAPIQDPGADLAYAVAVLHDVSHLRALDRIRSRFIANISHQLRTPVTNIKLSVEMLERSAPEHWGRYRAVLQQEAEKQTRLVEDLLRLSQIEAGMLDIAPEATRLDMVVATAVDGHEEAIERGGLHFDLQLSQPSPLAWADPKYLTVMIAGLLENAIQYTLEGGKVTVSSGEALRDGRHWALITIADTGVGIPADELPHIFEPFFRGEVAQVISTLGTGLGLPIIKAMAERQGGTVTVETQVDAGSTFTLWLPLADESDMLARTTSHTL